MKHNFNDVGSKKSALDSNHVRHKRVKISEDREENKIPIAEIKSESNSPKKSSELRKRILKEEIDSRSIKSIFKKPKKNITAYAFFIKEVSINNKITLYNQR
jgi:hypothetical protein